MKDIDFSNIGFDYGIKPFLIIVGDIEFSNLFKQADCNGIIYLFNKQDKDQMIPIEMGFLFKNEEPAKKFFDIILEWVRKSNNEGDAVSIDFIENNKNGYTLSICSEMRRFTDRMIPKNLKNRVTPIIMVLNHFKEIDSLGENYLNFKANYSKANGIAVGYYIGTPTNIVEKSKDFFVKKEFNFYNEDALPKNSSLAGYKSNEDFERFNPMDLPKPPKMSIEEISERRLSEMKQLLPLTFNKLENLWLGGIQEDLSKSFENVSIKQAICNLTVFERLKHLDISPDFIKEGYPNRILDYLIETYESFDSYYPDDDFYSEEKIINQIKNDKRELENFLKKQ